MAKSLKARIQALEAEIEHANGLLATRLKAVESLQETASKHKNVIRNLRADLKFSKRRNKLLEQRLEEVAQLGQFVSAERDAVVANIARTEEVAGEKISSLQEELKARHSSLETAKTREGQLMDKIVSLETSLKEEKQRSANLEEKAQVCKSAHENTKQKLREQRISYEELRRKNAKYEERVSLLESRISAAVSMLQNDNAGNSNEKAIL